MADALADDYDLEAVDRLAALVHGETQRRWPAMTVDSEGLAPCHPRPLDRRTA